MSTFRLKDFVDPIAITVQDPANSGFERFVGLEHYDSNELVIKRFSGVELLTTNAKAFQKNDLLIARRNVYLRRAGVVYFDGITSGDSIVLRVKEDCEKQTGISRELAQRVLPLVLNTDRFWIYANKHADGMNSKRISKDTLLDYEFDLPSIEEQKVLADKLWAAYKVKESYRQLLSTTDEMLKAKFQEMFGDAEQVSINEFVDTIWGTSPASEFYNDSGIGMPFYQGKTEFGDIYIGKPITYCTAPIRTAKAHSILMSVRAPVGDVNIATEDCCIGRGLASITPKEGKSTLMFIFYAIRNKADEIARLGTGSTIKAINRESYAKIKLPVSSINDQQQFAEIATQAEATKASLRASIEAIDRVIRSLINQ